jgi:hypothetical protein
MRAAAWRMLVALALAAFVSTVAAAPPTAAEISRL